ncbi:putative transposase [Roseibium hamelinense]|uniref:Putative transposase n=1 Tax=Roseibium hamelinense TaxID=150831 RepID=A0A562T9L9_9HYPH|nr:putative transposase [Roseibium hamelinense]
MRERGVDVDHATLNRWVVRYSPAFAANAKARKRPVYSSWRMDETYLKARNEAAATAFLEQAIGTNSLPERLVMDKSGAN